MFNSLFTLILEYKHIKGIIVFFFNYKIEFLKFSWVKNKRSALIDLQEFESFHWSTREGEFGLVNKRESFLWSTRETELSLVNIR